MQINKLILGDNLEIMKKMEINSIDLIYLDPPFFSNRNYEVIWGDAGEIRSFQDRWAGGVDHYIAWLKERVEQMHRLLKPTGSIFLHCDWHADAYIRVEILDKYFGIKYFKNSIVWKRMTSSGFKGKSNLGRNQDTILYYTKSDNYTFNPIKTPYTDQYLAERFNKIDELGRRFKDEKIGTATSQETIDKLKQEGRIYVTSNGKLRIKHFIDDADGVYIDDLWQDIVPVNSQAAERVGYPTQKPEALLERIIKMSTNEGDIVMDPFVGGGTTVAVADKLGRRWIGIDQSVQAVKVTEMRLNKQQDLFSQPFVVQLHKYDYDDMRTRKAFEFETWIIEQYGGQPNTKQRGDFGIDGRSADNIPIQVKRSDGIGRNIVDNFHSAVMRYDKNLYDKNVAAGKPAGIIIAFSFGRGAIEEVARLKNRENVNISLVTVGEIVPLAVKPKLTLEFKDLGADKKGLREIEFTAKAQSETGIEFFAWNWNYDENKGFVPDVMLDKEGRQTNKFKPGMHQVAVKVIDNEGLENIEVVKLKINGVIEKTV